MTIDEIIKYVAWLVAFPFIFRFHLEQTQINPYLGSVRTLIKVTDPFVVMLRSLVKVKFIKTIAPLIIAFILVAVITSINLVFSQTSIRMLAALTVWFFMTAWIKLITYSLVIYVILSWVRVEQLQTLSYVLYHFLQPVMAPIQRIIPPFGGIDISPLVVLMGLYFVEGYLPYIIAAIFQF